MEVKLLNREDFPILNKDIIYFDNGATTLKPYILSDSLTDYYNNYSANAHRGDYDISLKVNVMYENTRELVKGFINAKNTNQIAFTNNCTDALNKIVFGYFKHHLNKGDEVLLTKAEHASNILPWFELVDNIGIKVNYIDLDQNHKVTLENVKKAITSNTKVISIAHITNVVGDIRPIKEIIEYAHSKGIKVVIDGAQSVPHMKIDVQNLDMDFLAFSAHKMCGPTGVGVLYIKEELLNDIKPIIYGGGMNVSFEFDGEKEYKKMPYLLEAGTPNIADVIAFGSIINYLNKIGIINIERQEKELKEYALNKLKEVKDIIIYNNESESSIITFNIKDIFAQDLAIYLNKYNICVRAGNHCAKILKDDLGIKNTCRMSLYFYNTKEEIDKLVEVLNKPNIINEII
ncbi:MAG: cysteine desulfurase [Bacilli bacterium]|nr:cysteine desulfurase [Bacilli bacterium]